LINRYINNDGEIYASNELNLSLNNRAFRYGDGLFETIRIVNGKPFGLSVHLARMKMGLEILKIQTPEHFNESYFSAQIDTLISKNEIKEGGRCRLSVYRDNGGFYAPTNYNAKYTIEIEPLLYNLFELNTVGLKIDLYPEIRKQVTKLAQLKTANSLLYIMSSLYAQEHNLDDCVLQNDKLEIIESSSSNLFIVSNGVLYTPSLESGCVGGTMRMQIINLALKNGIRVYESNVTPSNLLVADEVLLTNAVSGIKWVGSYKNKRYFHSIAQQLIDLLNKEVLMINSNENPLGNLTSS